MQHPTMDDFEIDTYYTNDDPELDLQDIFGSEATEVVESGLSNADYNLDSPLNPDFINGLIIYLQTKTTPGHHRGRIIREGSPIAESNTLNVYIVKDPLTFHHVVGRLMMKLSKYLKTKPVGIQRMLEQAHEDTVCGAMYLAEF